LARCFRSFLGDTEKEKRMNYRRKRSGDLLEKVAAHPFALSFAAFALTALILLPSHPIVL
jgi:hypothetical protein